EPIMAVNVKPVADRTNTQPAIRGLAEKPNRPVEPTYPLEALRFPLFPQLVRQHPLETGNRPHPNDSVFCLDNGFHPILAGFALQAILGCRSAFQPEQLRSA